MTRRLPALLLALTAVLFGCAAPAEAQRNRPARQAPAEIRGTWMTTTANDAISSPEKTAESMARLREIGLNTVYVECWKNGYTEFPSQVMDDLIGVPMKINAAPAELQRDLVEETLIEAHRNQLIYIAWFEYGFMAAHKDTDNHLRREFPEWMTLTQDGEMVGDQNPFVWMNPLRPESRELLLGIVLEAVDKYDLDGVQLDDRIAWPVTMGYDPYTVAVYKSEHRGKAPPKDPRDPEWVQWRADKVTEFAGEFYRELKAARPNLIVSISPAIWRWSLDNYACDWPRWVRNGWMQEYLPQVYRPTYERFAADWPRQVEAGGRRPKDVIAGIAINLSTGDMPWSDLRKKIDITRKIGRGGHCHWFSRGVLETHPERLLAYYNVERHGHAPHPGLPAGWRPAPIVLQNTSGTTWAGEAPAGHYRVIVKRDGRWSRLNPETGHEHAEDGAVSVDVGGEAEAVELLVDRRHDAPFAQ
ncbi:MAG: family 10 glycosylhydrolase [Planctomycetota bacterium]